MSALPVKLAAAAFDQGVRLPGIKDHGRAPAQRYPVADRRKMQVQAAVLAQKQVAKRGAAIARAVVVVLHAAAGPDSTTALTSRLRRVSPLQKKDRRVDGVPMDFNLLFI